MEYGIIKTTRYVLVNKRWHKTEEWTEGKAIVNAKHWEEWEKVFKRDNDKAILTTNHGRLIKFVSYSPDGKRKTITELLSDNYELSTFDKLDNITDRKYNSLFRKAKKACQRLGINFDQEQAFTSSSDLHGFYLPNNRTYRGVFFIKGNAIVIRQEFLK